MKHPILTEQALLAATTLIRRLVAYIPHTCPSIIDAHKDYLAEVAHLEESPDYPKPPGYPDPIPRGCRLFRFTTRDLCTKDEIIKFHGEILPIFRRALTRDYHYATTGKYEALLNDSYRDYRYEGIKDGVIHYKECDTQR